MTVCLIGCFDVYLHPYIKKYEEIFKRNNIDYRFVFWNRSGEKIDNEYYVFYNAPLNTYQSLIKKIFSYLKFRRFVEDYINKNKFERIIFLTTQSIVLFSNLLKKKNNSFLFDYRDETYEKYWFYRKYVKSLMKKCERIIFSSEGFNSIYNLKKSKYVICHNDKLMKEPVVKTDGNIKRINYWGMIRQPQYLIKIIDLFANDERFQVNIYGEGYIKKIIDHIEKNQINNVKLHGKYKASDLIGIYNNTDIMLNAYSNKSVQKNALTVKMYEGIQLDIPMIVQKESFMDKFLEKYHYRHYSLNFDISQDKEYVKKYIIKNTFYCDKELIMKKIYLDNDDFVDCVTRFCLG